MTTGLLAAAGQKIRRSMAIAVWLILSLSLLLQTGCTRDEVAGAMATLAVNLQATLEPWGATVQANTQAIGTSLPGAIAAAISAGETQIDNPAEQSASTPAMAIQPDSTLINTPTPQPPIATETPTTLPTPEPTPTSTPVPTATPTEELTAVPTATPFPLEIPVLGGSLIFIPGGFFNMGATAGTLVEECASFRDGCEEDWFSASEPSHMVLVAPYYLDAHEVTNEAYVSFLNDLQADVAENACLGQACIDLAESQIIPDGELFSVDPELSLHPAAGVTWYGAAAYCAWRSVRLPTEAEWEKAASWNDREGVKTIYPWGDEFDGSLTNFCDTNCDAPQANPDYDDGYDAAAPVASFEGGRSPAGIDDLAGNVWEWVSDWYAPDFFTDAIYTNPIGPEDGESKVVRGGSWFDTGNFTSGLIRFPSPPENADKTIGFRCAADLIRP
jgi:formylglycine-generating enzyme required for sulfatase activity